MTPVLFSFVSNQDPISMDTVEEGSIVTLCRSINPEVVYLFPTAKGLGVKSHTEDNAKDSEEWIIKEISENIKGFIFPITFDPTEYFQVMDKASLYNDSIVKINNDIEKGKSYKIRFTFMEDSLFRSFNDSLYSCIEK